MAISGPIALLLEDEPLISMDIELALGDAGFDVTTVMSCDEALSWLDRRTPDVVIVDIELRDGPSTNVVVRLIEDNIPFVVHSGEHPALHIGTPFSVGAWVGKPAEPDELVHAAKAAATYACP